MTEQHPLTDRDFAKYVIKEIRIAYDKGSNDMLDRVIEWLGKYETIGLEEHDLVVCLIHDLKKAMRPQEDTP